MSELTGDYIELCRELALPRKWQEGDWAAPDERYGMPPRVVGQFEGGAQGVGGMDPEVVGLVWLPREGDWLDLLEAEGYTSIDFVHMDDGGEETTLQRIDRDEPDRIALSQTAAGPDRLTALCRLYMAVKGIKLVTPPSSEHEATAAILSDHLDTRTGG